MELVLLRRNPDVHVKALDGIVSANTFLIAAVFIGITGTVTPSATIPRNCVAGDDIAGNFFLFEILSFSFYLLSSLMAQGMKLAITLLATDDFKIADDENNTLLSFDSDTLLTESVQGPMKRRQRVLRLARRIMLLAAFCSIIGTFFLLLSMVDAIQLKFGLLSCNISLAVGATFALSTLAVIGLLFYGSTIVYALAHYLP